MQGIIRKTVCPATSALRINLLKSATFWSI